MPNATEAKLIALAADFLKTDPSTLSLDSGPGDVSRWDSFAHVGLIAEVEAGFDLTFDVEEIAMFETLRDIHDAVRVRLASQLERGND